MQQQQQQQQQKQQQQQQQPRVNQGQPPLEIRRSEEFFRDQEMSPLPVYSLIIHASNRASETDP